MSLYKELDSLMDLVSVYYEHIITIKNRFMYNIPVRTHTSLHSSKELCQGKMTKFHHQLLAESKIYIYIYVFTQNVTLKYTEISF